MWNLNLCKIFFSLITTHVVILGALINFCEGRLPTAVVQVFRYGKFGAKKKLELVTKGELPKSYYRHFYITSALIYCPLAFREVLWVYVFGGDVSEWFMFLLDFSCGYNRSSTVSSGRIFLAITLLTLQVCRRFFDTQFVSVFSKEAKINIFQYALGMGYYPAVLLLILSEAPIFSRDVTLNVPVLQIGVYELIAVILFMWAWYHQHVTTVILADLRKNDKGLVVNEEYKLPKGDWFNYLSSPHSSAEIIMYTALTLLLWNHTGWWYVYTWVLSNQVETILLSHWWYQRHFENFPQRRKALIPFVY